MFLLNALSAQDLLSAADYGTDKRSYSVGVNIVKFDAPNGMIELIAKSSGSSNIWTQRIQVVDIGLLVDYDDLEEDPYGEDSMDAEEEEDELEAYASIRRHGISQYSGGEAEWLSFKSAYPDVVLSDIRVGCNCPAFQYWGSAYIVDQLDSGEKSLTRYDNSGHPEGRFPGVRDPSLEKTICKHLAAGLRKFFS